MAAKLSRREAVATMLTVPLAGTLGCGGGGATTASAPPLPPGAMVGTNLSVGHKIRDGQGFAKPTSWSDHDVVIVGAGIAGLAAARRLRQLNVKDVALLELEAVVGGTSRSDKSKLVAYPWGAHYITAPTNEHRALAALLSEMKITAGVDSNGDAIVKEEYRCRKPEERLFYKGKWHDGLYPLVGATQKDKDQFIAFQDATVKWSRKHDKDGRRAFVLPVSQCSTDKASTSLDDLSMKEWLLQEGLDSSRLHWWVEYACRDDYGMTLDQTSAWAAMFYYAARLGGRGKSMPYITWPEGNGRLVQYLLKSAQTAVRTDSPVVQVRPLGDSKGVELTVAQGRRPHGLRAKRVVFAAPHFLAPYVVEGYGERAKTYIKDFQYSAWAVVNLQLSREPQSPGVPLSWDNVLHDSPALGYVSATHQNRLDGGKQHWTYYYPVLHEDDEQARERLLSIDRDGWADIALTDLERAHPDVRQVVERADVIRWGHAMIQPRTRFMWGPARAAAAVPFRGVYFAHSDLSGMALFEEAYDRGTQAADAVAESL